MLEKKWSSIPLYDTFADAFPRMILYWATWWSGAHNPFLITSDDVPYLTTNFLLYIATMFIDFSSVAQSSHPLNKKKTVYFTASCILLVAIAFVMFWGGGHQMKEWVLAIISLCLWSFTFALMFEFAFALKALHVSNVKKETKRDTKPTEYILKDLGKEKE